MKVRSYPYTLTVLLLLALALVASACGGGDEPAAANNPTSAPAQGQSDTSTDSPTEAPDQEAPSGEPTEAKKETSPEQRGGKIGAPKAHAVADPQYARPKRQPLAVMLENHPDSRPQTGLDKADVVYEAPAEYGIPRFLAIYSSEEAPVLGPVRSARSYYVAWASEYDPVYIHAGGSPQSLSWLKQLDVASMDALRYGGSAFERVTDRQAPHNLYTDTRKLRETIAKDPELKSKGAWGGLRFSKKFTVGSEEGREVRVTYDTGYEVAYEYDERAGVYNRLMLGKPHLDRESKEQLSGSVVIVQTVRMWPLKDDQYGRLGADIQDKGPALIFQDGRVIDGFWEKEKRDSETLYTTAEGEPVALKPGKVWIQIVPKAGTKIER
ncbi:MAG: DUF3048 domain-containing protein [Chloroflexota bacterium]|nr:DUF3048 domain-containing protein [Chloroflexota bacterium]